MGGHDKWVRECLSKKKYSTLKFANKVIQKIKKERGTELYSYVCPNCFGFHLTKKRQYQDQKDRTNY